MPSAFIHPTSIVSTDWTGAAADVDELVTSPDDSSFMESPVQPNGAFIWFDLTDMPSDFGNIQTGLGKVNIKIRRRRLNWVNDPLALFATIYESDQTTALTNQITCSPLSAFFENSFNAPGTVNKRDDKAAWDGARLFLNATWSSSMGADSGILMQIAAVEIEIIYDAAAGGSTFPISVTPALTMGVSLSRRPNRTIPTTLTVGTSVLRSPLRRVTVAPTLGVSVRRVVDRRLSLTTSLVPAVRRVISRSASIPLSMGVSLTRAFTKLIGVPLSLSVSVATARSLAVQVVVALTLVPSVARRVNRSIAVALPFAPTTQRVVSRNLQTALSLAVAVRRAIGKTITIPLSMGASVSRRIDRAIITPLTLDASLRRTVNRVVSLPLGITTTLQRLISRNLSVPLSFSLVIDRVVTGAGQVFEVAIVVPLTFAVRVFNGLPGAVVGGVRKARTFFFGRRGIY